MRLKTKWFATRFVVATSLYALVYTAVNVTLTRGIEAEIDWLKKQGLPTSPEELMRPPFSPDVRPEEDARPLLEAAAALWNGLPEEEMGRWNEVEFRQNAFWTSAGSEECLSEKDLQDLGEWIQRNDRILQLLKEASLKPSASCSIDYRDGPTAALVQNIPAAQGLVKFVLQAAAWEAHKGNRQAAYDLWNTSFGPLQGISGNRGSLVGFFVRQAIGGVSIGSLLEFLEACPAGAEELQSIAKRLARLPPLGEEWAAAMRGEAAGGVFDFTSWFEGRVNAVNKGGAPAGCIRLWLKGDYLAYLRFFRKIHEHQGKPSWVWADGFTFLDPENFPFYAPLTQLMVPAVRKVSELRARAEALRLTARYGVQMARHKLAAGAYPETLESLAPDLRMELPDPVDPFTGQSIVYRREGEGFVVYSLGANKKDDGGLDVHSDKPGIPQGADDIAFQLTR